MSNDNSLNKSARRVQDALTAKGLSLNVIELSESTRTAQDAAKTLCCKVGQIVKSLIFRGSQSGKPILVLASGNNRVDENKVEKEIGEPIAKADADFVRKVTGFAIGGIPPMGHRQDLLTLIDEDLFQYDLLWAAAGTHFSVFSFPSAKIQNLIEGKIISIKSE